MRKILLVEDDRTLNDTLTYHLNKNGYHTASAYTKAEALEQMQSEAFDIILLDVALPDGDGFALCRSFRDIISPSHTAILFLTADDLEQDVLKGYNLGADDYITKPFSLPILLKKIDAISNRVKKSLPERKYSDGRLAMDFASMDAYVEKKAVDFTPLEFQLLELLVQNSGHIVTRQKILDAIWDKRGNYVEESSLNSMICRIRGKIDAEGFRYIKTIYGTGYMWIAGGRA